MFIMKTRSTMAVMSNSGGSGSSRREKSWSEPVSPRLKLDDSMDAHRSRSILEEVENAHQAGAEGILQNSNPGGETGEHEIEGDGGAESHRGAYQGDADFGGDLRRLNFFTRADAAERGHHAKDCAKQAEQWTAFDRRCDPIGAVFEVAHYIALKDF